LFGDVKHFFGNTEQNFQKFFPLPGLIKGEGFITLVLGNTFDFLLSWVCIFLCYADLHPFRHAERSIPWTLPTFRM